MIEFEFRGEIFSVPEPVDWPITAMEAGENEHWIALIRAIVGEQFSKLENLKMYEFTAFMDAMGAAYKSRGLI